MKILFIRFSSIGDIVLATPVFRCTKQQIPNVSIHFACKVAFKAVTEHNPYIDKFHYLNNNNLSALIDELKAENFDYVIDLHKNFRSYKIITSLKKPSSSYKKLSIQKLLLTKTGINLMPERHITLRSLDAVKSLGVQDDGGGLDYFIGKNDELKQGDLPLSHVHGFIALVIGASYATKKLPNDLLIELCSLLNYPLVLVGGKEDAENAEIIAASNRIMIYNACGKFSLNESAAIVQQSKLVISHDTGLQYIACAFGKKVLAIWGGTSPKLAVEPFYGTKLAHYGKNTLFFNFLVPNLSCQPCSNFGTKNCPKKHFKCMKNQNIGAIAQKAKEILGISA
ncbi:MAG: glycosyltransferase family 9 protein [Chitinophagaceae bacterium]